MSEAALVIYMSVISAVKLGLPHGSGTCCELSLFRFTYVFITLSELHGRMWIKPTYTNLGNMTLLLGQVRACKGSKVYSLASPIKDCNVAGLIITCSVLSTRRQSEWAILY